MNALTETTLSISDAPAIPGLTFRGFRGPQDYPVMLALIDAAKQADKIDRFETVEDIARNYKHLINCDPFQDMLFAEVNGEAVAYQRVFWEQLEDGTRLYNLFAFMRPEWRRRGIGTAMLRHAEQRLRQIAALHPMDGERLLQFGMNDTELGALALARREGYKPVRYEYSMRRDLNQPLPEAPMPEGVEVRPVSPDQVWTIFDAANEAFRDHWGYREQTRTEFENFLESPTCHLDLWRVGWAGDQVAGMVLNYLNEEDNRRNNRKRGWTENISVRRPWRRLGLARSLLVQSMRMFKDMGMTETALGVDAENPNGALRLYQSVGYHQVQQVIIHRKPLDAGRG